MRGLTWPPVATLLFWTLMALMATAICVWGPVLTSDGPAHVVIAHFLVHAGDPAWPMLNRLYEVNWSLTPNAFGHLLLAGLMLVVKPVTAEQILQLLYVVSLPLAGRLVLRQLTPAADWLALFFFPVALQRTFFLGLYNYCLSVTGCLLCLWAFLRLRERVSARRTAVLAGLLLLTLACQASGWMEAVVGIGTILVADCCLKWRGRNLVWETTLALLPSLGLFAVFALGASVSAGMLYGPSPLARLTEVVMGSAFAPIGRSTAVVGLGLGLTLGWMFAAGLWRARSLPFSGRTAAVCVLPVGFLVFALIIPDRAGGGWTHTWRAEPLPYVGLVLACGLVPVGRWMQGVATTIAGAGALVAIGMMAWVQAVDVPPVSGEFHEADGLIGPHCTVAPVLGQFKLDPGNTARLFYHPLFHIASRLALTGDRPVLFSYVARLPIYPARFRPEADPMRLLFGWQPGQSDTHVYRIDPKGYEAATGIPVDYVMLWDMPAPGAVSPFSDIRPSVVAAGYQLVFQSSHGRMTLYRRPGLDGCQNRAAGG